METVIGNLRNFVRFAENQRQKGGASSSSKKGKQEKQSVSLAESAALLAPPSFSERQQTAIKASWTELAGQIQHVGVVSFVSLFEHHMEFKRSFSQLKDLDSSQMRNSPLVKAHGMAILRVLEQLVHRIHCVDKWYSVVEQLAAQHVGRDVKPDLALVVAEYSWKSIEPILRKSNAYDRETEEAWLILIGWLGTAMQLGLSKAMQAHNSPRN